MSIRSSSKTHVILPGKGNKIGDYGTYDQERASLIDQLVKNLPAMQETPV